MATESTSSPSEAVPTDGEAPAAAVAVGEEAIAAISSASVAEGSNEANETMTAPPASGSNNIQINNTTNNVQSSTNPSQRSPSHIHVHIDTPGGVRGVNIPLPPGANASNTVVSRTGIVFQRTSQQGAGATTNNHQPQAIRIRQSSSIPPYQPLQAQPLPNQINYDEVLTNNQSNQDKPPINLNKFECSICFEYMEQPVSCGGATCSSRFCAACLNRVLREEITNRNARAAAANNSDDTTNDQSAKCPHCRTKFTKSDIQIDRILEKQINESTNTVTCPFKGCNTEVQICKIKQHEETCPYIRMKCRYADWGCNWTGRKMDLESHYTHDCEFCSSGPGLPKFIERYRKTVEHDHRHLIDQNRSQLQGFNQMQSMQSRQVMMMKSRNPSDILDVLALSYQACCFTGRLVLSRDVWSTILMKQGCRATLGNMLLSFPTMVLVGSVSYIVLNLGETELAASLCVFVKVLLTIPFGLR